MIDKECLKKDLKLYLVTDSEMLEGRDFYKCIEDAIASGITTVQLREKNTSGKEFLKKAMRLREITRKHGVKFIINDRVDIAIICDADGVHVGQSDIDAKEVRKLIGKDKILGVSARTLGEAICAKNDGADYLGIGSIFTTSTKLDAKSASFETVKEIKEKVDIPFVLIGGIKLDNIDKLKCLNSDGYAIISAILKSENISEEVEKWTLKI
ncbi:thiamine phosphate synthase [Clostridioides sp. ZZV15-6598]|uniref:thiamine phosphate synthase n=1 Tax=Clostridioides sp. ZZV15-6598 TaxID=2811501 RepID=UPI001D112FEF|nr:thiamine phosphate synthase [Clostridioides sp. ZZV15-6598]